MLKFIRRINFLYILTLFFTLLASNYSIAEVYRVTSIAPGMSPFVVNTAITKVVNKHVDGVEFQLRATGAATKHFVDAAKGDVDFLFGSPTINMILVKQLGPFKNFTNGAELEKNVGWIFSYEIGPYHYVVKENSGIKTLADLKGKKVFLGPPGGAALGVVLGALKQTTGLEKSDFDLQQFGFDAAIQAFQDDKIDAIVLPTNVPSSPIQQFALTKKIRILDVDMNTYKLAGSGTYNEIAPDAYGSNQVNAEPARTHGAIVNFSAGMHVSEDVVYKVTKAIWENLEELYETAEWMKNTIKKDLAMQFIAGRAHPGAVKYYKEIGWSMPEPITWTK